MQIISSAGPAALAPEATTTVHVCGRDAAGYAYPLPGFAESTWPAWKVSALAELISRPIDGGTILRQQGYKFSPRRAALVDAAHAVLEAAESCRRARWSRAAPYRLGWAFFHTREEARPGGAYLSIQSPSVLSALIEAADAPQVRQALADRAPSAQAKLDRLAQWTHYCSTYASIPPPREAELMKHGYTAAEFLLDQAAEWVETIADIYELVQGNERAGFTLSARTARAHARTARKVIEQGIRHALNGEPIEFAG